MTTFANKLGGPTLAAFLGAALLPGAVLADGEYLQFDVGREDVTVVASAERSGASIGLTHSRYDGGNGTSIAALAALPLRIGGQDVTARVGPVLHLDDHEPEIGAKLVIESYRGMSWGGLFGIAEVSSVDTGYFAMVQANLSGSGLSFEVTANGDDDGYHENALVAGYRLGQSDLRLRLGYKIRAEELFVGISLNTF